MEYCLLHYSWFVIWESSSAEITRICCLMEIYCLPQKNPCYPINQLVSWTGLILELTLTQNFHLLRKLSILSELIPANKPIQVPGPRPKVAISYVIRPRLSCFFSCTLLGSVTTFLQAVVKRYWLCRHQQPLWFKTIQAEISCTVSNEK